MIAEGCELEDIEALVPNELPNTLNDLKNRALGLLKEREITIHEVPTDAGFEYVMGNLNP